KFPQELRLGQSRHNDDIQQAIVGNCFRRHLHASAEKPSVRSGGKGKRALEEGLAIELKGDPLWAVADQGSQRREQKRQAAPSTFGASLTSFVTSPLTPRLATFRKYE